MQKPKAILFDLDGVLTDTSEYHYLASLPGLEAPC